MKVRATESGTPCRSPLFCAFEPLFSRRQAAQEISGYAVTIDPNQNVLVDDTLRISYVLVPVGVAVKIYVEEGLSLTANKT